MAEGGNAEFTCKFISNPAPSSVQWFRNETEELSASETLEIVTTEDTSILRLMNVKSADTGVVYTIKIVNELGEIISNKATLNVNSGPVIQTEITDQKVLRDKEAKFECVIKGNPKPNVIWLFNGKELTTRDGARIEKDATKDKYLLVIPKVTIVGSVTVKATNDFGAVEQTVQLDVLDTPKALNKLENVTVNENEPAKFVLKVAGKPKPQVKWFRDEEEIIVSESYEITEESEEEVTLVIKSCKSPDNAGNYYAKISNEFGEVVSNKATLIINRGPKFISLPKDTVAIQDTLVKFECIVDSNPKAKLTWFLNGKELTNKEAKFEADAKTNANYMVIAKASLANIGSYTIKATNAVGESEHSFNLDVLGKLL